MNDEARPNADFCAACAHPHRGGQCPYCICTKWVDMFPADDAEPQSALDDALEAWWHDDHFGDGCEDRAHTETCVETAFRDAWNAALCTRPALDDAVAERIAETAALRDAAEMLWVVLANVSGGDWSQQTEEWQVAAARWRDVYFAAVAPKAQEPH